MQVAASVSLKAGLQCYIRKRVHTAIHDALSLRVPSLSKADTASVLQVNVSGCRCPNADSDLK